MAESTVKTTSGSTYERAVSCLSRHYEKYLDSTCTQFGVTGSQVSLLMYLWDGHDGVTQNQIAHALGVDKGTVSRNVKALVEAGLVTQQVCERDSRACSIDLTESGREMAHPVMHLTRKWTSTVTAGMTQRQRQRLTAHLSEMAERAALLSNSRQALQP